MKVILLENITSLGVKGDIKNVSDGYASNFLLPQKKALIASLQNIFVVEQQIKTKSNKRVKKINKKTKKHGTN